VAANSPVTRVVRQRYLPVQQVVQLPPADVRHLMFVIVSTVTEGAVVVFEAEGSLRAGMVHGVGTVIVVSADFVSASVALRYRLFQAQLEATLRGPRPAARGPRPAVRSCRTAGIREECRHGRNPGA
jgi:hypothetical protein